MTRQELKMLAKLAAEGNKAAKKQAPKKESAPAPEAAPAAEPQQPQIERSQQLEQPNQQDYYGDFDDFDLGQGESLGLYEDPYSWYWEPYSKVASAHDAYELGVKLAFGAAEKRWGMQKVSAGAIGRAVGEGVKRVAKGGARRGAARSAESAASRGRASAVRKPTVSQGRASVQQPAAPTQAAAAPAQAAAPVQPRPAAAPAQPGPAAPGTPQQVYAESSNAFANIPKPKQPTRLDRISEDARRAGTQPYPTTPQPAAAPAQQAIPPPPQRGWGWKGMMGAGTLGAGVAGVGLGGVALGAASQGTNPSVYHGNYPSWTAPQQPAAYGGYMPQI